MKKILKKIFPEKFKSYWDKNKNNSNFDDNIKFITENFINSKNKFSWVFSYTFFVISGILIFMIAEILSSIIEKIPEKFSLVPQHVQ